MVHRVQERRPYEGILSEGPILRDFPDHGTFHKGVPFQSENTRSSASVPDIGGFTSGGSGNTSTEGATSGGRNNQRGQNNNGNNNNGSRSRIQYDANSRPIVQCRACNLWGHFACDCTTANTPKLLCRWCGPSDHEDAKCPKSGVNLIIIGTDEEEVLAITWKQAKVYPDPTEEKKRLEEARVEIQKATQAEKAHLKDTTSTSAQNCAEQNIVRRILQTEVPVKINNLLLTMPQLRTALTNIAPTAKLPAEQGREK